MGIICIVGPTAVGKTALALSLAKLLNGEIISCDSMQVYKGMDIGTAKPKREELEAVKHHLIDIIEPSECFSCADYATLAREAIHDIQKRGKTPIFCGGTGLYLDSVFSVPSFEETERDEDYRRELNELAKEKGAEALHKMLEEIDMESALATHKNNVKRVIRALEIYKCTGVTKSEWDKRSRLAVPPYESTVFFLTMENRELLYKKIEERVDIMLSEGLLEEARALYESNMLLPEYTASGAIGYKELLPYIKGECSLDDAVSQLKLATRHYAKRQLTWFNRHKEYHKICVDVKSPLDEALRILNYEK